MSREDMNERVEGPLDYKEFVTLVELAENIEERLDRYWHQLVTLLLVAFVSIILIVYSLALNFDTSISEEPRLFGYQSLAALAVLIILATATTFPGAARRYIAEMRAYAEATNLLREVYSLLERGALTAVQGAEVEVRMSRLRLPSNSAATSLIFLLLPGLRRQYERSSTTVRASNVSNDAARLERHLRSNLEAFFGPDHVKMDPSAKGVTIDALVEAVDGDYLIDLLYFRDLRSLRERLTRSRARLLKFTKSLRLAGVAPKAISISVISDAAESHEALITEQFTVVKRELEEDASEDPPSTTVAMVVALESTFLEMRPNELFGYLRSAR